MQVQLHTLTKYGTQHMNHQGEVLKEMRVNAQMTEEDLARRIGEHTTIITRMEDGYYPITEAHAKVFGDVFHVDYHVFLVE